MKAIAAHDALADLEKQVASINGTHALESRFSAKDFPDCVLRDDVLKLIRKEAARKVEGI